MLLKYYPIFLIIILVFIPWKTFLNRFINYKYSKKISPWVFAYYLEFTVNGLQTSISFELFPFKIME